MTDQVQRTALSSSWIDRLEAAPRDDNTFLANAGEETFVIENHLRRKVPSGLVAAALSKVLGVPRDMSDAELAHFDEGVPVEVLEAPHGKPFVIVGGRRLPIRAMPLPHPVGTQEANQFPGGPELNLAAANVSRTEFEDALRGRYQIRAARDTIERKGVVSAFSGWGQRAWRRIRR